MTALPTKIVVCGVLICQGEVFVARRASGFLKGLWEFPGGKPERGETHRDALKRELREELGVELPARGFVFLNRHIHHYDQVIIDLSAYVMELQEKPGIDLVDHDDSAWVDRMTLQGINLSPSNLALVELVEPYL